MLAHAQTARRRAQVLVDRTVAVVVLAVAGLRARARHRGTDLVLPVDAVVDSLQADPHAAGRRAQILVNRAVAVVVLAVTGLRPGAQQRIAGLEFSVDAVVDDLRADSEAARRGPQLFVGEAVAVVVLTVADLCAAAFERIARLRLAADAVLDYVLAHAQTARRRAQVLVDRTVAVVVDAVARLRGRAVEAVALNPSAAQAGGEDLLAGADAAGDRAEALVRLSVTVIVEAIAGLVDGTSPGVTLPRLPVDAVVDRVSADPEPTDAGSEVLIDRPVAVLVAPAAGLLGRTLERVTRYDVPIDAVVDAVATRTETAGGDAELLVLLAVAVVVLTVTEIL